MREKQIKVGDIHWVKSRPAVSKPPFDIPFYIKRIQKDGRRPARYYNEAGEMRQANELTKVRCIYKGCPCH